MKEDKVVYVQTKNYLRVVKDMNSLMDKMVNLEDRHFWKDKLKEYEEEGVSKEKIFSRSTDIRDKKQIYNEDVKLITNLMAQLTLFGRILRTNKEGVVDNYPKLHFPMWMRMTSPKGREMDYYNLKQLKSMSEYLSSLPKEKIEEFFE
ncbi:hypothetical protein N8748_01140 [bacterium]|jgi:hypothetical protein|nr:hypothetical protein [bacterium]|tara:strand:- start:618 stop:1061 length:444 start_codon:yes stop_codon:yes gene_type:complete